MAESNKPIDPAALAVAALAGILALSTKGGRYDLLALMTSVTLVLVLFAFIGESKSNLQRVAFGAVLALCSTEGVGTLLEWSVKLGLMPRTTRDPCNGCSQVSITLVRVIGISIGTVWAVYGIIKHKHNPSDNAR